jgi:predicted ATPase/signal transduction histidine kinase
VSAASWFTTDRENGASEVLWEDGERVCRRIHRAGPDGVRHEFVALLPAAEVPSPDILNRFLHEYELKDYLDSTWAVRPRELVRERGQTILIVEHPGGEPLHRLIGMSMDVGRSLQIAVALSAAIGRLHGRGLIHKDIKPAHVLVNSATGEAWLTGFGIASRLPRERQTPGPPEFIAGTLAYMAPEQTGRMNRSIDSRSDLYSLGITLYELLTGKLPFTASDPMEWIHCHIARQPALPSEGLKNIPGPVCAVILKLLAKTAEERYQTAAGVENDLRRCLSEWNTQGRIDDFKPGERDTPDRLLVPEKLYGREKEIELLLAAFDRVVGQDTTELVLVSGYSGVGKSCLVNELHKVLVAPRGLFASGKFDLYQRNIPYATLAQAFGGLVRPLLSKDDEELAGWRSALLEALGSNGQLIVNLIPELEFVLGEQPSVPELQAQDAKNRFQRVFKRFLAVFARPEHPLVLFLDDLQWVDQATLELLQHLAITREVPNLLLIGAYRDNEIDSAHPLAQTLAAIEKQGIEVQNVALAPLALGELAQLVRDSLRIDHERVRPLIELLHEKTQGNPFFAIQFLTELTDEGLLVFNLREQSWQWDLDSIFAKKFTDNIVDLMEGRLGRLPAAAQEGVKILACLGNSAPARMLAIAQAVSEDEVHASLAVAIREGLIVRRGDRYSFLHDRVQEAAYELVPHADRAWEHLRIGRRLVKQLSKESVFEIVNQLNQGWSLITSSEERKHLAELNLAAGQRSISSTAYTSAQGYLCTAASLLDDESWEHCYSLAFDIELHRAQCEFLAGDSENADRRLTALSQRARGDVDRSEVACLQIEVCTATNRSDRAVEICLEYLRGVGIEWTNHPTKEQFRQEYDQFLQNLAGRSIEALVNLPRLDDHMQRATLNVLSSVVPSAFFTDENLLNLTFCRTSNISVMYGNDERSPLAYTYLGSILRPQFGDHEMGYRLGKLGIDLVEQGLDRWKCRVYVCFGSIINPWSKHVRTSIDWIRQAFESALEVGDLTYAGYCCQNLIPLLIANGNSLAEVQSEALKRLEFARKIKFGLVIDSLTGQIALIRQLRGLTLDFSSFDDGEFDENTFEQHLERDPLLAFPACWYWIRKLQARFYASDYFAALGAAVKAESLLWTSPSFFEIAEYHFFSALSHAALYLRCEQEERQQRLQAIAAHQKQLAMWAKNCPETFENRATLVAAEIARIENRLLDAEQLYEQAIRSAHNNDFVHNEAVANECAAQFYTARGFSMIADAYLRNARDCYGKWGAAGKVRQLEAAYPQLRTQATSSLLTVTIDKPLTQFDVETVVKASQTLSSEINLPNLIEKFMRLAVEHAGAARGLLILMDDEGPRIEAEAISGYGSLEISTPRKLVTSNDLPLSTLQYVLRTRERVLIDDAFARLPEPEDQYIRHRRLRSVLCLPILKQKVAVGALYLENNLTAHAFTSGRVAVLDVLASQAAISLENARLYASLNRSEKSLAEAQRLSSTGSFLWRVATDEILGSRQTHRIFGTDPEAPMTLQLVSSRIHPEDLPSWHGMLDMGRSSGSDLDYECRLQMLDGSVKYLHIVAHANRNQLNDLEYIGAIQDVTERRLSEAALGRVRSELAHVSRVSTLGNLSASIAHELNQPLSGVIMNASTCLRRLAADPPNVEGAVEIVRRVIRDANRASDVINRLRALFGKKEKAIELVDLNEAARELVALSLSDFHANSVTLQSEYADDLPLVTGDRVQLQQVILNLLRNATDAMTDVNDRPRHLLIKTELEEEGRVRLTVRDSGIGFSQDGMDQLFNAFYTTKSHGMGMGLSVSRSIIESHNGRLWAVPNDGPGVTFSFSIPITPQA